MTITFMFQRSCRGRYKVVGWEKKREREADKIANNYRSKVGDAWVCVQKERERKDKIKGREREEGRSCHGMSQRTGANMHMIIINKQANKDENKHVTPHPYPYPHQHHELTFNPEKKS